MSVCLHICLSVCVCVCSSVCLSGSAVRSTDQGLCYFWLIDVCLDFCLCLFSGLCNLFHRIYTAQQDVIVYSSAPERQKHCRGTVFRVSSDDKPTYRVHLVDYGAVEEIRSLAMAPQPEWVNESLQQIAFRCRMREIDYGFEPHDASFKESFRNVVTSRMLRGRVIGGDREFLEVDLEYGNHFSPAGRYLQLMGFQRPLV